MVMAMVMAMVMVMVTATVMVMVMAGTSAMMQKTGVAAAPWIPRDPHGVSPDF